MNCSMNSNCSHTWIQNPPFPSKFQANNLGRNKSNISSNNCRTKPLLLMDFILTQKSVSDPLNVIPYSQLLLIFNQKTLVVVMMEKEKLKPQMMSLMILLKNYSKIKDLKDVFSILKKLKIKWIRIPKVLIRTSSYKKLSI